MIKTILLHNNVVKLSSCIIGYLLWNFISQYQTITLTQIAPLCFHQTNEQISIKAPEHIKIIVSGTRKDLYHFDSTLYIDASSYQPGTQYIQLSKDNLFLPDTIKLVQLIPSHLSIEITKP